MYDIENLKIELSSLGDLTYFDLDEESGYTVIVIQNFIDNEENIASYYSIIGKYLKDYKINQVDISQERLKSDLNKII